MKLGHLDFTPNVLREDAHGELVSQVFARHFDVIARHARKRVALELAAILMDADRWADLCDRHVCATRGEADDLRTALLAAATPDAGGAT